jgi:hypothetical protein
MGPDVIIGIGPLFELLVVLFQLQVDIVDFIKLLPVRPVRPLDSSVQFERPRRKFKHEEAFEFLGGLPPTTARSGPRPGKRPSAWVST